MRDEGCGVRGAGRGTHEVRVPGDEGTNGTDRRHVADPRVLMLNALG